MSVGIRLRFGFLICLLAVPLVPTPSFGGLVTARSTTQLFTDATAADFLQGAFNGTFVNDEGALELLFDPVAIADRNGGRFCCTGIFGWSGDGYRDVSVLYNVSHYEAWPTGIDSSTGQPSIGVATSPDALSWQFNGLSPILTAGAAGTWESDGVGFASVLMDGGTYRMWYTGTNVTGFDQIGAATSTDGIWWTRAAATPILSPNVSWEIAGVSRPVVLKTTSGFAMWYVGLDAAGTHRIGFASSANGMNWTESPQNPILGPTPSLPWASYDLGKAAVVKDNATYRMWLTGYNSSVSLGGIGYLTSPDGLSWTDHPANPLLTGETVWNRETLEVSAAIANASNVSLWSWRAGPSTYQIQLSGTVFYDQGSFVSRVFDSGSNGTTWQNPVVNKTVAAGESAIDFQLRTGESSVVDANWSSWVAVGSVPGVAPVDRGRSVQYQALLRQWAPYQDQSPVLHSITVSYVLNSAADPIPTSPNGWTNGSERLVWDSPDPEGDWPSDARVQIATSADFSTTEVDFTTGWEWWSVDIPPLPDGRHYWRVRMMDAYGLWSNWSAPAILDMDTVEPGAPTLTFRKTGPVVNVTDIRLNVTATDDASGVAFLSVRVGKGRWSTSAYQDSLEVLVPAVTGDGLIQARVMDRAGNVGPVTTLAYFYDDVAPAIDELDAATFRDGVTNSTLVSLNTTASDRGAGVEAVGCRADGGQWLDWSSNLTFQSVRIGRVEGPHPIECRTLDRAGNVGPSRGINVTLDQRPPVVREWGLEGPSTTVDSPAVTLGLKVSDPSTCDGDMLVREVGGEQSTWIPLERSLGWNLRPGVGNRTVEVLVRDCAGNVGVPASTDLVLGRITIATFGPTRRPGEFAITGRVTGGPTWDSVEVSLDGLTWTRGILDSQGGWNASFRTTGVRPGTAFATVRVTAGPDSLTARSPPFTIEQQRTPNPILEKVLYGALTIGWIVASIGFRLWWRNRRSRRAGGPAGPAPPHFLPAGPGPAIPSHGGSAPGMQPSPPGPGWPGSFPSPPQAPLPPPPPAEPVPPPPPPSG